MSHLRTDELPLIFPDACSQESADVRPSVQIGDHAAERASEGSRASAAVRCDLAIIGSGFAGAILAMAARRSGLTVVLIERVRHPRFAIGESSTPLANLLLEEIADEFDLPFLRSLSKWGSWQKDHVDLPVGLKRGFTFYRHELSHAFPSDPAKARERMLMVGASPNDRIADTHWFRSDFDAYLVREAAKLGVVYWDRTQVTEVQESDERIYVSLERRNEKGRDSSCTLEAEMLVDASGPRGALGRLWRLPEKTPPGLPATQALFSHFRGVGALDSAFLPTESPYPAESAAVHHLFPGGWMWVLKFNNGLTSAGVAVTDLLAERWRLHEGEAAWQRVLNDLPSVRAAFALAEAVSPFTHQPRLAFQSGTVTGARWALLPSAAGVIDPLLSTGFPLTLLGVQRLARLLKTARKESRNTPETDGENEKVTVLSAEKLASGLMAYADTTTREYEVTSRLIGALYARFEQFEEFKALSLLYFVAASFSETARRLGRSELVPDFLLNRHPVFGAKMAEFCSAEAGREEAASLIRAALESFDVAGMTDHKRDPWYPARAEDLFHNAHKLKATKEEIAALLKRCGME
ncbi:MAG TPA: FAD-dependent oxidoreductase [Opitutaceae bacterium]